MNAYRQPVVDADGNIMFRCDFCAAPIAREDFYEQGLRLPDPDESADDYRVAELLDSIRHLSCVAAASQQRR